jgi:hypothetical protein
VFANATIFQAVGYEFDCRFPLRESAKADIAQLVERQFCKLRVGGSSPSVGSNSPKIVQTGALAFGSGAPF